MTMILTIAGIIFVGVACILAIKFSPQFGAIAKGDRKQKIAESRYFDKGRFVNLAPTPIQLSHGTFFGALKEYLASDGARYPSTPPPAQKVRYDIFHQCDQDRVIWLGHSSILVQLEGKVFLIDPMFGKRASPLPFMGPKRFNSTLPLSLHDIANLDGIVISHDHYDHLDYRTIRQLHQKTLWFVVPLGIGAHLQRWGVANEKIIELEWWQECSVNGIRFVATPSRHFSGRRIGDRNRTLWTSWVIVGANHKIYFGADSGYGPHFKEIGSRYGPFDLTMLECGAYSKYWPYIHMLPEQTAQAHLDLKGNILLPIHWAQFNLSMHPWTEPIERLLIRADQERITVATPMIGEPIALNNAPPQTQWWQK